MFKHGCVIENIKNRTIQILYLLPKFSPLTVELISSVHLVLNAMLKSRIAAQYNDLAAVANSFIVQTLVDTGIMICGKFQWNVPLSRSNKCVWLSRLQLFALYMMTSSNRNIFRVTGHLCGNSPITGDFPAQRPMTRSFYASLICAWINGWVNNREGGDFRRHCAQYDITVLTTYPLLYFSE